MLYGFSCSHEDASMMILDDGIRPFIFLIYVDYVIMTRSDNNFVQQ